MPELLEYEFVRNALAAAMLASIACGIIGAYVVIKRIVFISGGIAHTAFGGIGLGYFLGMDPLFSVLPFSIAAALCIGLVSKRTRVAEDSAIGMFWAAGMALGAIFIGLRTGYAPDLFSYLFGNILMVPAVDLKLMAILDTVIIITVFIFYKEFLLICFDEEFARVSGLKVTAIYLLLLSLVALTVVLLIKVVGIILVISLLTIPASIARQYTFNLKKMMGLAVLLGILFTVGGLIISYWLDLASGATIVLLSVSGFGLSLVGRKIRKELRLSKGHGKYII